MPPASMTRFVKPIALSCVCNLVPGFDWPSPLRPPRRPRSQHRVNIENVDFERHLMGLFRPHGLQRRLVPWLVPGQRAASGCRCSVTTRRRITTLSPAKRSAGRIDSTDPDHSLLLLKATGPGRSTGRRRPVSARTPGKYQLFRQWIMLRLPLDQGLGGGPGHRHDAAGVRFQEGGAKTGQLCIKAKFAER